MFWVIRGTDPRTDEDFAMVVETQSQAAAEMWALKRGIPIVILEQASNHDIEQARLSRRLWKYTAHKRLTCFGQPVAQGQLLCLMLSGLATIVLLARIS